MYLLYDSQINFLIVSTLHNLDIIIKLHTYDTYEVITIKILISNKCFKLTYI